jgi:Flp pilus assembly protein TadD
MMRWAVFVFLAAAGLWAQEELRSDLISSLPVEAAKRAAIQSAIGSHDLVTAEELLAEEAKRSPRSQPILLALANVLFRDGKHLNSIVVLKKAELVAPLDERSRYLLALSYVTIHRQDQARPVFEQLAQAAPSNALYPYWLSRLAYRKMNIEIAVTQARKALQLDPTLVKAHDQLGLSLAAQGNAEEASRAFETAIKLNREQSGHSPWPSINLGTLLLRSGRLEDAERRLREAIAIDSRIPVAHHRLGQVLEKGPRTEEAIAEFEQAAQLDPTYPDPHYALARIYRRREDTRAPGELSLFQELRRADAAKGVTRPD